MREHALLIVRLRVPLRALRAFAAYLPSLRLPPCPPCLHGSISVYANESAAPSLHAEAFGQLVLGLDADQVVEVGEGHEAVVGALGGLVAVEFLVDVRQGAGGGE